MTKATFHTWADMPQTMLTPEIGRRLVTGEKVMLVYVNLTQGAIVGEHHHPHEQITYILSGRMEFNVNGEKRVVDGGGVVVLPPHVPHAITALTDSVALDAFSPPREDFLSNETPDYMQK